MRCPFCNIVLEKTTLNPDVPSTSRHNIDAQVDIDHVLSCIYKLQSGSGSGGSASHQNETNGQVNESSDVSVDNDEESSYTYTEKTKDTHRGLGLTTVFRRPNVIERSFDHAFERLRPQLIGLIEKGLDRFHSFKIQLETSILFRKADAVLETDDELIAYDTVQHLWIPAIQIHSLTDLDAVLDEVLINFSDQISSWVNITSNWTIFDVLSFKVYILQSNPLKRADGYRKLPTTINPRFIVTPFNVLDEQCFFWACAIHLTLYEGFPLTNKHDWLTLIEGHSVPNQDQLKAQFGEKYHLLRQSLHLNQNEDQAFVVSKESLDSVANSVLLKNFNLVVYTHYNGEYTCVYSTHRNNLIDIDYHEYEKRTVEILLYSLELPPLSLKSHQRPKKFENYHSALVLNFDSLLRGKRSYNRAQSFACRRCFAHCTKKNTWAAHMKMCPLANNDHQILQLAPKTIHEPSGELREAQFTHLEHCGRESPAFVSCLDTEAYFQDGADSDEDQFSVDLNPNSHMNEMKAKIAAVGTVCIVGSPVNEPEEIQKLKTDPFPTKIRVGNQAVLKCLYDLTDHAADVQNRLKKIRKHYEFVKMSKNDQEKFDSISCCEDCGKTFTEVADLEADLEELATDISASASTDSLERVVKCRDHSKIGLPLENAPGLRFVLCLDCNLRRRRENNTHVCLVHNLPYDSCFLLTSMLNHKIGTDGYGFLNIKIVPKHSPNRILSFQYDPFCPKHQKVNPKTGKVVSNFNSENEMGDNLMGKKATHASHLKSAKSCECYPTIIFKDSLSYSQSSLASLVESQAQEVHNKKKLFSEVFFHTNEYFQRHGYMNYLGETCLLQKMTFPYLLYSSEFEKGNNGVSFLEMTELPRKEQWVLNFRGQLVSDEDYNKFVDIWSRLTSWCENQGLTMSGYQIYKYYLLFDIFSTLDTHLNIASAMFKQHGRHLFSFLSLPSFALGALVDSLGKKNQSLYLVSQPDQWSFFASNICGGICSLGLAERYGRSNVAGWDNYDATLPEKLHLAVDETQLYATSMAKFNHPHYGFRTFNENELKELEKQIRDEGLWKKWTDEAYRQQINEQSNQVDNFGLGLIVDLDVADENQELICRFPPVFLKQIINPGFFSPHQQKLKSELRPTGGRKRGSNSTMEEHIGSGETEDQWASADRNLDGNSHSTSNKQKTESRLIATIANVRNYNLDWKTLSFLLKIGYRLKAIRYAVEFKVSPILASFIMNNVRLRRQAKSKAESDREKLKSNAIFGKVLSKNDFKTVTVISGSDALKKQVSKQTFERFLPIGDQAGLVVHRRTIQRGNSPIQVLYNYYFAPTPN